MRHFETQYCVYYPVPEMKHINVSWGGFVFSRNMFFMFLKNMIWDSFVPYRLYWDHNKKIRILGYGSIENVLHTLFCSTWNCGHCIISIWFYNSPWNIHYVLYVLCLLCHIPILIVIKVNVALDSWHSGWSKDFVSVHYIKIRTATNVHLSLSTANFQLTII